MFLVALLGTGRTWKQTKCPSTDGHKNVVHTHNKILLSHLKEQNNAICSDMEGPRDCHTEWSKSDREKQILYDIAYMWHLQRTNSLEKTLMLGKTEVKRRRGRQRMKLDNITDSADMNSSTLLEITEEKVAWCAAVHRVAKSPTQLSDWTTTYVESVKKWHKWFIKSFIKEK